MGGRDWLQFDFRSHPVTTSPSRISEFIDCPRSWCFDKIFKLPKPPIKPGPFGETLHGVAERFAQGDDVEMYPGGWDADVSSGEAELIRCLISKAIEEGVLRRLPGAIPESPFQREILDENGEPTGASLIGFGDLIAEDGYEDHKTTINFRYNKTEEALAEDAQMMIGGAEVVIRAAEKGITLDSVWLRHNYFLKDRVDPKVKPIEVTVSRKQIEDFWYKVVAPTAACMVDWKKKLNSDEVGRWKEIPRATSSGVCKKYSGCPFLGICSGTESPAEYKVRMIRQIESFRQSEQERKDIMASIFDTAKKKSRPVPKTVEEVKTTPVTTQVTTQETAPETTQEVEVEIVNENAAPWYNQGCMACSTNATPGFNTRGEPCRACDAAQKRAGGPTSLDYTRDFDDGLLILTHKEKGTQVVLPWVGEVTVTPAPAPKPAKAQRKPRVATADKVKEATAETPQTIPVTEPEITPPSAKTVASEPQEPKKRGRPRRGFTLIYGTQKRGKEKVLDLHQILHEYGKELAEHLGSDSYYNLDFGKRRDYMAARAEQIAEKLGPAVVVVTGRDPDILTFAAALEPFAADVFIGGAL